MPSFMRGGRRRLQRRVVCLCVSECDRRDVRESRWRVRVDAVEGELSFGDFTFPSTADAPDAMKSKE